MIHATTILHFALRDTAGNSPYINGNSYTDEWVEAVIELAKLLLGKSVNVQKLCGLPDGARTMLFSALAANPSGHRLDVTYDPYERHLIPQLQEIEKGKRAEIRMSHQWGGFSGKLNFPGRSNA
jgi:hypothetical protein